MAISGDSVGHETAAGAFIPFDTLQAAFSLEGSPPVGPAAAQAE